MLAAMGDSIIGIRGHTDTILAEFEYFEDEIFEALED